DLHCAPLFRVVLCQAGPERWELFLLLHHIIGDGWSVNVISEELWHVYTDLARGRPVRSLPPAGSFAEYMLALQARAASEAAARDREWWAAQFHEYADALAWSLPGDPPAEA